MDRTKVFVSYSHQDRKWLDRLMEHLAVLERENLVHTWSDTRIGVGADWEEEIDQALIQSKVAVLLVSPGFLASRYIWDKEMKKIEEHRKGGMEVLPLIVRPCAWRLAPQLAQLQVRPVEARPLAIGNDAQVDLDLSALVYDLAAMVVDRAHANLATAGWEVAEQYRTTAGKDAAMGGRRQQGWTSTNQSTRAEELIQRIPQSWGGKYNDNYLFRLTIQDWAEQPFRGTIDYLGTGTVTRVEGELTKDVDHIAAVSDFLRSRGQEPQEGQVAVVFREIEFEQRGNRQPQPDLKGEYRAFLSEESMVGAWFRDGGDLVAGFELEPV